MAAMFVEVGRDSGATANLGTFGKADRFNGNKMRTGPGVHSPHGAAFYQRNQLFKRKDELGKECTQGIGNRSQVLAQGSAGPQVGPGSYEIVASAAGPRTSLDGPEYCSTTMKIKLGSSLVPFNSCSPGPHAKYDVRKPMDYYCPNYPAKERLAHGLRTREVEDDDGPGPGGYEQHAYTIAASCSAPSLKGAAGAEAAWNATRAPRRVKSTFGMADRFGNAKVSTCSPNGEYYYAHSKFLTQEDYLAASRTCGFGGGQKTDLANLSKLGKAHLSQVSPVTYFPVSSSAKPTSSLDGFASRCASPVYSACKSMSSPKRRVVTKVSLVSPTRTAETPKIMHRQPSEPSPVAAPPTAAVGGDGGGAADTGDASPEGA